MQNNDIILLPSLAYFFIFILCHFQPQFSVHCKVTRSTYRDISDIFEISKDGRLIFAFSCCAKVNLDAEITERSSA